MFRGGRPSFGDGAPCGAEGPILDQRRETVGRHHGQAQASALGEERIDEHELGAEGFFLSHRGVVTVHASFIGREGCSLHPRRSLRRVSETDG